MSALFFPPPPGRLTAPPCMEEYLVVTVTISSFTDPWGGSTPYSPLALVSKLSLASSNWRRLVLKTLLWMFVLLVFSWKSHRLMWVRARSHEISISRVTTAGFKRGKRVNPFHALKHEVFTSFVGKTPTLWVKLEVNNLASTFKVPGAWLHCIKILLQRLRCTNL